MGHRLTKIYTRRGDGGESALADGQRLPKDHPRFEALGTLDELNAAVGMILALGPPADLRPGLLAIQQCLFDIGAELSLPGRRDFPPDPHKELERWLDELNSDLPPLQEFILPGGTPLAAACHQARTVCRRAERRLVTLHRKEGLNLHVLTYLNRLSDLLFVLARVCNRRAQFDEGIDEPQWQPRRPPD